MIERLENMLAVIFGAIFLALSVLITLEVLLRKLFGFSLQGSHELGGYALAVGATLSFTLALFGRNHIRIDIIHERLPRLFRAVLNCLSSILMAIGLAVKSLWLLISGKLARLDEEYQPKSAKQELEDELDSASQRQRGPSL